MNHWELLEYDEKELGTLAASSTNTLRHALFEIKDRLEALEPKESPDAVE